VIIWLIERKNEQIREFTCIIGVTLAPNYSNLKNQFLIVIPGLLLLMAGFFSTRLYSQDMAGIGTDRFGGVNRVFLNPALILDSPNCYDISLVSGNVGFQNNYLYIARGDFGVRQVFNQQSAIYTDPASLISARENITRITGRQNLRLHGPSASFKYGKNAFAFTNGVRMLSHARQLPVHVVRFITEGLSYTPQLDILYDESKPFGVASMSWAEAGLSYARELKKSRTGSLQAGISGRRLWGYHAAVSRADRLNYLVNSDRDIIINNINFLGSGSLPSGQPISFSDPANAISGKGFSFDLGVTYHQLKSASQGRKSGSTTGKNGVYAYSIGVSLLDLGAVRLKQNIREVIFDDVNLIWRDPDGDAYETIDDFLNDMESRLVSGVISSEAGDELWVYLPSGISGYFDYNLGNNFFTNVLWVQDLPFVRNRVSRSSWIGVIPRYETRLFTFALPITLYEYSKPRVGASVRFGFLTLGTEQPGGMLGLNDLDGMDFYFSIQWGFGCGNSSKSGNPCMDSWR
jgi:hypothetical protein